jgi:N-acetylneuraminic acid mutarotase
VSDGENIYIIGGSTVTSARQVGFLPFIDKLSIHDGTLVEITDRIIPRRYLTAEIYQGKIYILGGVTRAEVEGRQQVVETAVFEVFDLTHNSVDTLPPLPTPRRMAASVLHDGKIYVIGGSRLKWEIYRPNPFTRAYVQRGLSAFPYEYYSIVEIYDIRKGTWSRGADMPTRRECEIVLQDGKIYAIGGYNGSPLKTLEVYDIATDTWKTLPNLPFPLSAHHGVAWDHTIYTFGDYQDLSRVCRYYCSTGEWQVINTNYLNGRHTAVVRVADRIYLVGGYRPRRGPLPYIEVFNPSEVERLTIPRDG